MKNKIMFLAGLGLSILLIGAGSLFFLSFTKDSRGEKEAWHTPVYEALPLSPRTPLVLEKLGKLAQGLDAGPVHPFSKPGDVIFKAKEPEGLPVAIIIDDMGLSLRSKNRVKGLPSEITLSYLPYAPDLKSQIKEARAEGHEIMVHMPMEPMGNNDPGPDALLTSLSPDEIKQRIRKNVGRFDDFDGINNHMGSRFTSRTDLMKLFFSTLTEMGVRRPYFIDSFTIASSVAEKEARKAGFRTGHRNIFLDDTVEEAAILRELEKIGTVARKKGSAIVIGHPHLLTTQLLKAWIPTIKEKGLRLVPVSTLVQ